MEDFLKKLLIILNPSSNHNFWKEQMSENKMGAAEMEGER